MIFDHVVLGLLVLVAMFCAVLAAILKRKVTHDNNNGFIV